MNNPKNQLLHKIVKYGYKYELTKSADYKSRFDNYVNQYDILIGGEKCEFLQGSSMRKIKTVNDMDILINNPKILKYVNELIDLYNGGELTDKFLSDLKNKNLTLIEIFINDKLESNKNNTETIENLLSILISHQDKFKCAFGESSKIYKDIVDNMTFIKDNLKKLRPDDEENNEPEYSLEDDL